VLVGGMLLGGALAIVAVAPDEKLGTAAVGIVVAASLGVVAVIATALVGRTRLAWNLALAVAGLTVALYLARGV
jgi:hypothetical protein